MNSQSNPQPVPLDKATILLNHGPLTMVSAAYAGRKNVMAASWVMPLDFMPPKVLAVINSYALTRELIESSGEFVVSIPAREIADKVLAVGSCSGRVVDKFSEFGLGTLPPAVVGAPLIDGCVAWLECKLIPEAHNQENYDLLIGEVVAAWADPRVFKDGQWDFDDDNLRTIHYVTEGNFVATGEKFRIEPKI